MFQTAFQSERSFSDHENYPDGFSKSDSFTDEQAALLKEHGHAYSAFASGKRLPIMPLEKQFVEFCKGMKLPSNIHEQTWFCYVSKAVGT